MASPDRDQPPEPESVLRDLLEDPQRGRERLPYVVGLFESDDRQTRLSAAWVSCLVAEATDDEGTVEYLVRRLTDRLDGEHASVELTTVLDYISTRHPEQVERILEELEAGDETERLPLARVGNFTRNHYYGNSHGREGVGRTRIADGPDSDDPRRAYADTQREERQQDEYERGRERDQDEEHAEDGSGDGDGTPEGPMGEQRTELNSIARVGRFDKLHILAAQHRDRYADIYDSLVGRSGEERAIALRLFRRPETPADREPFARRIGRELERWHAVDGHPHILSVLDWDVAPRPWLATDLTRESLADTEALPVDRALEEAQALAGAVSHLHGNGLVHGGIDPGNVVYPGEELGNAEGTSPLLDNVGLLHVFRFHFEPARCLDPRYAAPEYFDDKYGRIDHTTDIYHLGAVLYRLVTGKAPFSGQFREIRDSVLTAELTPPTERRPDLPDGIDEVVTKAMATAKLTRYETVEQFDRELTSVAGSDDG